jgi:hypothetical protein
MAVNVTIINSFELTKAPTETLDCDPEVPLNDELYKDQLILSNHYIFTYLTG